MRVIAKDDIEEMILLGDDVVKNLIYSYWMYGYEGEDIFKKHDKYETIKEYINQQRDSENCYVLLRLIRNSNVTLSDVSNLSAKDILDQLNDEIIKKAIGIFRRGTIQDTVHNDTNFYVDEKVDDEYLKTLLAMRIRDLMIVHATQREHKNFYLLTYTSKFCHDGDEWLAITDNLSKLRRFYENELKNPLRMEYHKALKLSIYEFHDFKKYKLVTPEQLWGITYNI